MRRLLRFKRHLPSYQDCARLAQFADDAASPMTAAATHYALGKALIHASAGVTQQDYADDMRRRGAGHLRQALDAAILTPHRAGVATALLGA
jgi:hypothetical protein